MRRFLLSSVIGMLLALTFILSVSAQSSGQLTVLDRNGKMVTTVTDGNAVRLVIEVTNVRQQLTPISFYLGTETEAIGTCQIPAGEKSCTTAPIVALGWYWNERGQIAPERDIFATMLQRDIAVAAINVRPRPVVLVHGFNSDYTSWSNYLGPAGYLTRIGLPGYAVGDGQVAGVMDTGNLLKPKARTNTIVQNGAILAEYIANVKAETGAEQVDLVVHSMGGFISRWYINSLMGERDVAQLIMLGTPHGGSDCALLASGIGWYEPAAFEIRSNYMLNVFNPQVQNRRGIPFYEFAGTAIQRRILSPCSSAPNDLVVSLESASAIPTVLTEVTYLHFDENTSEELFTEHVAPLLRKSPRAFAIPDVASTEPFTVTEPAPIQFSQIFTGFVRAGAGNDHIIDIDGNVAVASFGLYDPSRTLTVTVRGANGNVITLDPDTNGLTIVDDPASLLYLGYGFENPKPGPWRVTVQTSAKTPPLGVDYAIMVQYVGGASIDAQLSSHIPAIGERVDMTATLTLGDVPISMDETTVVIHTPDGGSELIPVADLAENGGIVASYLPEEAGVYGIDVNTRSFLPDGSVVQRSAFLAFEVVDR